MASNNDMHSAKNDPSRFDAFFSEHVAPIASYCRGRSRCRADAEDAVAEVFLIAWRRFDNIPDGDRTRLWLYTTARHVLANQTRGRARRDRLSAKLARQRPAADEDQNPLTERVHEALATMPPGDREILLLAEWQGLSPREIAATLGRPAVSVRVRLHRARKRFHASFASLDAANTISRPHPADKQLEECSRSAEKRGSQWIAP